MKEMRPTSGKVMQALFNILGDISQLQFLDLFSGSGQIAFCAASKGAIATLVESDRRNFGEILKKAAPEIKCMNLDVRRALPKLLQREAKFDIIFADPPYMLGWGAELPKLLEANHKLLAEGGWIVFEHSQREKVIFSELWQTEDRNYGETTLTFATRREF